MGGLGSQSNLNHTAQQISNSISNDVIENVKINEVISTNQGVVNNQIIEVPLKYTLWRDAFCKNRSDGGDDSDVGLKNVIVSDLKSEATISDTVRVSQLANISNKLNNEISNDTEQSNSGVPFGDQSNNNSTSQSISNDIFNRINQGMDFRSNIDSAQSQINIQKMYIYDDDTNGPIFDKKSGKDGTGGFEDVKSQLYGGLDTGPNLGTKLNCKGSDAYDVKCGWKFPDSLFNTEWCKNTLDCAAIGNNIKSNLYSGATISNTIDISQTSILSNSIINKLSNKTVQSNTGPDFLALLAILIIIFAIMCIGPFFIGIGPILNALSGVIGGGLMILIIIWFISFGLFIYEITFSSEGGGCIGPNMCGSDDDSIWCGAVHLLAPDGFGCTKKPDYILEIKDSSD